MIAQIDVSATGLTLIVRISVHKVVSDPVWCFSLIGPKIFRRPGVTNGRVFRSLLPDLNPDDPSSYDRISCRPT